MMLVVDKGNFCVVVRGNLGLTARQFPTSVVNFWIILNGLPGAFLDCIAFEGSDLYERLEGGILKNGLVLYGDNTYINTRYMATPFPNILSDSKDYYYFFSVSAAHPC